MRDANKLKRKKFKKINHVNNRHKWKWLYGYQTDKIDLKQKLLLQKRTLFYICIYVHNKKYHKEDIILVSIHVHSNSPKTHEAKTDRTVWRNSIT